MPKSSKAAARRPRAPATPSSRPARMPRAARPPCSGLPCRFFVNRTLTNSRREQARGRRRSAFSRRRVRSGNAHAARGGLDAGRRRSTKRRRHGDPSHRAARGEGPDAAPVRRRARLLLRDLERARGWRERGLDFDFVQDNESLSARGRHAARPALPGAALRAGQARAGGPGRDPRRGGRRPPRLADLRALGRRGDLGRERRADPGAARLPARLRHA